MRWAYIETATNIVTNVIEWDGVSDWAPDEGFFVIQSDTANIGDTYDPENGTFTPPD
jgi:hypothetical protein